MSERGVPVPAWMPPPPEPAGRHGAVVSAISEMADHVRAYGLHRADDLLTELLAVLLAEPPGPRED